MIGVEIKGHFKAYPFSELSKYHGELMDNVAGQQVKVIFYPEYRSGKVLQMDGTEIPTVNSYWFAWYTFHPHTDVFSHQ